MYSYNQQSVPLFGGITPTFVNEPHFFIKLGEKYRRLNWSDVAYMRADGKYTCIFNTSDEREYPIRSTLTRTLNDIVPLPYRGEFVQINRAEAVHLAHITEFCGQEVKTRYNTMHLSDMYSKLLRESVTCLV